MNEVFKSRPSIFDMLNFLVCPTNDIERQIIHQLPQRHLFPFIGSPLLPTNAFMSAADLIIFHHHHTLFFTQPPNPFFYLHFLAGLVSYYQYLITSILLFIYIITYNFINYFLIKFIYANLCSFSTLSTGGVCICLVGNKRKPILHYALGLRL